MKAALLLESGQPMVIEDIQLDPPRAGEVRVRIAACGVCHSDWHVIAGDTAHVKPVILGHEGAGIVEETGPGVRRFRPGDRVVLSWAPYCGECFYCVQGSPQLCAAYLEPVWAGRMLDHTSRVHWRGKDVFVYCGLGAFAEQVVVPEVCCIPVEADIPLEVAALVGCAVATGVGAVLRTAEVRAGSTVAVFGCGGVGLNVVAGAALVGAAQILAIDPVPHRRELARTLGATHLLDSGDDPVAAVRSLTGGRGADYVFEAVGHEAIQMQCVQAARPGGRAVFVGLAPMGRTIPLDTAALTREEKVVQGSYYGSVDSARDFPMLLALYRSGRLPLDSLITGHFPLEQINEAYAALLRGEGGRTLIVFPTGT